MASESGFLEDGFKDLQKQKEAQKLEAAEKRKAGFKQVRALDPHDGNKMKILWVKKDEATIEWEAQEAKRQELKRRHHDVARKKQMLEMLKTEKELAAQEKELADMEKKFSKEGLKYAEDKADR